MTSEYFSPRALRGLNRIGDMLIPGDAGLPSFSEYGCSEKVDDLVAYAPAEDIATLNTVLAVMAVAPTAVLRWLIERMTAVTPDQSGTIASLMRQLNFGLRGILFSLYYGEKAGSQYTGPDPLEVIGYQVRRVE
ncbi:MAG: hypothetical protein H6659_19535 [Ardenticatenaceae bacterium]|nr:hypothetical protein [Anaerolineales bacterium]MCB8986031.1 hypothetical protein [Ardenticatenaceae bacterium]